MIETYSTLYYIDNEILISNEDFEIFNNFKFSIKKIPGGLFSSDKYACFKINNKEYFLHQYIYSEILKVNILDDMIINHHNNNKLDNRRENLRIINKLTPINITSKYFGVSFNKHSNKWEASIYHNNKTVSISYENEIDAAYQYDLFITKYNLNQLNKNNIHHPKNFKEILKKNKHLQSGIIKYKDKFRIYTAIKYSICCKKQLFITSADSFADAIKVKNMIEFVKTQQFLVLCEINSLFNKYKNKDGNYIFIISNKEVIIDKNMYFNMYKYNWYINKLGYVKSTDFLLSRFIIECNDKTLIVDHINGNILDNRKCNLLCIKQSQNTINKKSVLDSSSEYIGVHYDQTTKKWISQIKIDDIKKYLGSFDNELDAAIISDVAIKKYYKEYGKLNFEKRLSWNMYMMNIAEAIKLRSPDFNKVGAVLVSMVDNRIISTGYNSLRSGINDEIIDWTNRQLINDSVIHAEMNFKRKQMRYYMLKVNLKIQYFIQL